jgi:hypothetical protein
VVQELQRRSVLGQDSSRITAELAKTTYNQYIKNKCGGEVPAWAKPPQHKPPQHDDITKFLVKR